MTLPRVDFTPENYEQLIAQKGYNLLHYRSILCPCISEETGQPDPNCPLCDHGYQYWGEEVIKGLIGGVTHEKQFSEAGGFLLGSMMLTVPAATRIGYHDRIVHEDSTIPYSELLTREESGEPFPLLRYPVVEIEQVKGLDGEYLLGVDYELNGCRNIMWAEGRGPAPGERYSVVYQCHPVWGVLSYLHLIRDTSVKLGFPTERTSRLPVQVLCKLEFLMEP